MGDNLDDVIENATRGSTWLRIFIMLMFYIVLYVTGIVLVLVTLAQALFAVFSGEANSNLKALGVALTRYVEQILGFLTYNSEFRPFPFAPFPEIDTVHNDDDEEDENDGVAVSAASSKAAASGQESVKTPKATDPPKSPSPGKQNVKVEEPLAPESPVMPIVSGTEGKNGESDDVHNHSEPDHSEPDEKSPTTPTNDKLST
ncbi:MAG: DUF4389 domain-containing protein [Pseudohongiellaceae bacterium]